MDAELARLMAYASSSDKLVLGGSLAPSDCEDVQLRLYTDADWAGDPHHSRSTSGVWLEFHSPSSGRTWPIAWSASLQTCTGVATADTEVAAASLGLRREAIPAQGLLEVLLGRTPCIQHLIDNTQAILAIQRGYSKKLRHVNRTQRVNIGFLKDVLDDPYMQYSAEHGPSAENKADLFTKSLLAPKFKQALAMIEMYVGE